MNDLDSVAEYMTNYLPLTEKHSWPLYNMDIARIKNPTKKDLDILSDILLNDLNRYSDSSMPSFPVG